MNDSRVFKIGIALAGGWYVTAGALELEVTDATGAPLADAVVFVQAATAGAPHTPASAVIDQVDKRFLPAVSVVQTGTQVTFPNKDNIRHHVYSFSPAKTFELKLYSGIPTDPVVFENAGLVSMGCNIHDGMVAHLYVVESTQFALTDAQGRARLPDLSADAVVTAWHYRMQADRAPSVAVSALASAPQLTIALDANAPVPPLDQ